MNTIQGLSLEIPYINKYPFVVPEDYDYQTLIYSKGACIYLLKFPNNKIYIGSALDLRNRLKIHRRSIKIKKHFNILIERTVNKYGIETVEVYTLEESINKENLLEREQYYLDLYKSYDRKIGYNICKIAGSKLGTKQSLETIKKRVESLRKTFIEKGGFVKKNKVIIPKIIGEKVEKEKKEKIIKIKVLVIKEIKPILQLDKNNNIINEFYSLKEAALSLNKNNKSLIGSCLRGRSKQAYNYLWKYKEIA